MEANVVPAGTLMKIRASIEDFDVVENLVVRPHPDGQGYEVLSGNHRLGVYADLGRETTVCHVVDLDDARARILGQTLSRTRGEDDPEKSHAVLHARTLALPHGYRVARVRFRRSHGERAPFVTRM